MIRTTFLEHHADGKEESYDLVSFTWLGGWVEGRGILAQLAGERKVVAFSFVDVSSCPEYIDGGMLASLVQYIHLLTHIFQNVITMLHR